MSVGCRSSDTMQVFEEICFGLTNQNRVCSIFIEKKELSALYKNLQEEQKISKRRELLCGCE